MSHWTDTPLAAELLAELRRLTDEFETRISEGHVLPGLASLQAIGSRAEDLAGWVQHLVEASATTTDSASEDDLIGEGLYL